MKRLILAAYALTAVFALLLATGCSDGDPFEPLIDRDLQGQVVDANGDPLPDVAIGLIYDVPYQIESGNVRVVAVHPLAKPQTRIAFDLPEGVEVRVWITDRAGSPVATLVDETMPAGGYSIPWSAVDDDGNPVPAGLYTAHIEREGEPVETFDLLLIYLDPGEFLNAPNAMTDAEGCFRVSNRLIPAGDVIPGVVETEGEAGDITIGDQLRVMAVREGDPDPVWARITVDYDRSAENSGYRIVLP